VLEATERVDTVVLDKTGTITQGRMQLVDVVVTGETTVADVLHLAGSAEDASEHPIAVAIARAARERGVPVAAPSDFSNDAGLGVRAVVDGHDVVVGRPSSFAEVAAELRDAIDAAGARGRTAVVAGWDGAARAVLVVADTVKVSA